MKHRFKLSRCLKSRMQKTRPRTHGENDLKKNNNVRYIDMKIRTIALFGLAPLVAISTAIAAPNPDTLTWQAITFGQSTDLNFGSTILPNKIGTNEVLSQGKPVTAGPLLEKVTIESRGGKLANSHEGGTFYYTKLPTNVNFTLSATITLDQLGPETGATPNRQEGAGIMVRDIIGAPRANPQPIGHEEFPSASNMVMNLLRANSKKTADIINATAVYREGIHEPWGNPGNKLSKKDYVKAISNVEHHPYKMTLTRTNDHFQVTIDDGKESKTRVMKDAPANIIQVLDPKYQYLGFFASRNAKIDVSDIKLTLSDANTSNAAQYKIPQAPLTWSLASSNVTTVKNYTIQARANYDGVFAVTKEGRSIGLAQKVKAGELFQQRVTINKPTDLMVAFQPTNHKDAKSEIKSLTVTPITVADPLNIYVSPNGKDKADGSKQQPLSLASAIKLLAPGGTIHLTDGDYPAIEIPFDASGSKGKLKRLSGEGAKIRFIGQITNKANYWHLDHIEVAGAGMRTSGSHNLYEYVVTHNAPDTGFQISSPNNVGRSLWASYNTVRYSESYDNMDASQINADGFAAKIRVGEGNRFEYCISHHNIDDGWDLFNKVEDGPNGAVTIVNSISFNNGQTLEVPVKGGHRGNGFKLGGEGLPVSHVVKNNLSFNNNMDGFTDNFNPGKLTLDNNIAIDNHRFNFIVRQSPYGSKLPPATLSGNISLNLVHNSQYNDAVHGDIAANNAFIKDGGFGPAKHLPIKADTLAKVKALLEAPADTEKQAIERAKKIRALLFKS